MSDLVALPLDLAGTLLFVPIVFCVYCDVVAVPMFATLCARVQNNSPIAVTLFVAILVIVLWWASSNRVSVTLALFASVVAPTGSAVIGHLHGAALSHAGTMLASAFMVLETLLVTQLLLLIAREVAEYTPARRLIGGACIFIVIARAEMILKYGTVQDIASGIALRVAMLVLAIVVLAAWIAVCRRIGQAWREWAYENPRRPYVPPNPRDAEEHQRRARALEKRRAEVCAAFRDARARE